MHPTVEQQLLGCKYLKEFSELLYVVKTNILPPNYTHLVKPFSFHDLTTSGGALSPAFAHFNTLVNGETIHSELRSEDWSVDVRGPSSILTGSDASSCALIFTKKKKKKKQNYY